MKLVDILARELKQWPESVEVLSQLRHNGAIINGKGYDGREFDRLGIAEDTNPAGVLVTRTKWQAAVDALRSEKEEEKVMSIDWSKAPEGAEYYSTASELFYRDGPEYFEMYSLSRERWVAAGGERHEYIHLLRRPDEWNGQGLPPVGTMCECRVVSGADWVECEVVAHKHKDAHVYAIAFVDENTVMLSGGVRFRPIRTAEQIAADERKKAIDEMTALSPLLDKGWSRKVCEALYDADYRKQVQE